MLKPGTGQNVEDMLSSVRRLVSDELPRMARAEVPKGPEALVLKESQRIEAPMAGHNSRRKSLEDRIAELEAAVAESSDDWEPDGSEDLEQHRPDRIVFRPSRTISRPPPAPLQLSEVVTSKVEAAPDQPEILPVVTPEPAVTGLAAAVDRSEVSAEETEEELHEQVETALTEAVTSAIADMADAALSGDDAFEQALADAVGVDDASGVTEGDGEDTSSDKAPLSAEPVRETLDAADIRPLISTLIREELQGDLGERITRNVRKLVRQEIQRALTVREVE